MWRVPASKSRCLVPAMEWYEWKEVERINASTGEVVKAKQPYPADGSPAERLCRADVTPDGRGRQVRVHLLDHNARCGRTDRGHTYRMPIAVPKDAEGAWLDPDFTDAALTMEFARGHAMTDFVLQPVGMRVNNARSEGADLIESFRIRRRRARKK